VAKWTNQSTKLSMDMPRRVDFKDLMLLTQRQAFSQIEPELKQAVIDKYGADGAKKLIDLSANMAEDTHAYNAIWEKRLIEAGIMGDPKLIQGYAAELKAARQAVREAVERNAPEAEVAGLRIARDRAATLYNTERQKGVGLGRDYGHAQIWNRTKLFEDPEGVKAFLHKILIDHPAEDWLVDNHHMTLDEFNALPEAEKTAIKRDWTGDSKQYTLDALEYQISALESQLKTQQLDLRDWLKWFGAIEDREESLTLSEARKKRDRIWSQLIVAQELKKQLPSIRTNVNKGADPSIQQLAKDMRVAHPITQATEDLTGGNSGGIATAQAFPTLGQIKVSKGFHNLPLEDQQRIIAHEQGHIRFPFIEAFLSMGNRRNLLGELRKTSKHLRPWLWQTEEARLVKYRNDGAELIADAHSLYQTNRAMAEKLMPEATKLFDQELGYMKMSAAELDDAMARAQKLEAQWAKANETLESIKRMKKDLRKGLAEKKVDIQATAKELGKAQRQLEVAVNKPGLNELIDDVYRALSSYNDVPHATLQRVLDQSDRTTGRVKMRVLNLTREQRAEAIKEGWLHDDFLNVMRSQTDQLAAELAIHEAVGIGKGKRLKKWADLLNKLDNEYQDMIGAAATQEERTKLAARHQKDRVNLIHLRDRLRGATHIDDGTASQVLRWSVGATQATNLLRYGSGFLPASMTDLATMALQNGGLTPLYFRFSKQAAEILTKAAEEDPTHFQAFISAVEVGMGAHASARRFGTEDPLHGTMYGYGMGTGLTRKVTAKFDQTMEKLNDIGMKIGGLPVWNKFNKTVAGLYLMNRMADDLPNWGTITDANRATWASLGIGKVQAENISTSRSGTGLWVSVPSGTRSTL
jgi:hypothetical protein